jgi:hypothetical protein
MNCDIANTGNSTQHELTEHERSPRRAAALWGYYRIESSAEIVFNRKAMKMKPAVWYGLFTGGLNGEIAEFGREEVRVIGTNKPL